MTEVIFVKVVFWWQFSLFEAVQVGFILSGLGLFLKDVLQELLICWLGVLCVNDKLVQIIGDIGQAQPGAVFLYILGVHAKMDL